MKSFYTCAHKNIPLISVSLEVLQDPISSLNSSAPSNKLLMSVTPEVSQDEMWPYFDSALVAPSSHCLTDFFKCFVIEFHNGCLNLLSNGLCIISVNMLLPKPEDFKYMKIYVKPRSGWN